MTNESIREGFDESKIKATDIQLQSNLNNENYEKLKSNEVKEEDLYLKIEDFPDNPISDIFFYEQAIDKIRPVISMMEEELKGINLKNLRWNNIAKGKRLVHCFHLVKLYFVLLIHQCFLLLRLI